MGLGRDLWNLAAASLGLGRAKLRGIARPCPPHDFSKGYAFCERCGRYRDELGLDDATNGA